MIRLVCSKCGFVFVSSVILGLIDCPKCGSSYTHVAIYQENPHNNSLNPDLNIASLIQAG